MPQRINASCNVCGADYDPDLADLCPECVAGETARAETAEARVAEMETALRDTHKTVCFALSRDSFLGVYRAIQATRDITRDALDGEGET